MSSTFLFEKKLDKKYEICYNTSKLRKIKRCLLMKNRGKVQKIIYVLTDIFIVLMVVGAFITCPNFDTISYILLSSLVIAWLIYSYFVVKELKNK